MSRPYIMNVIYKELRGSGIMGLLIYPMAHQIAMPIRPLFHSRIINRQIGFQCFVSMNQSQSILMQIS